MPAVLFVGCLLAVACSTSSTTTLGPSVVKCAATSEPPTNGVAASGGMSSISVAAPPECAWTATTQANWVTELSPSSGQGNGQIQFRAAPNPAAIPRQADILINDVAVRLTQQGAGCSVVLTPVSQTVGAAATSAEVLVSTADGCGWTAVSSANWIAVTDGTARTGSGRIVLDVSANAGAARSGTVTVAGRAAIIEQDGSTAAPPAPNCSFSIFPAARAFGPEGGPERIDVTTQGGCSWTASSHVPWISIAAPAGRTGNGPLHFIVGINAGAERVGTITIAGQTLTATQAGAPPSPPPPPTGPVCTYATSPTTHTAASSGGSAMTIAVTAPATCAWTAASNASWLTITNGISGTGSGTVTFSVAANPGPARTGAISVGDRTFTVNQLDGCTFDISRSSQSFGAAGGAGTPIGVTAAAACSWTAVASDTWITLTSAAAGTGNGTVAFSVAESNAAERTGTITVAGRTFAISQASGCSFTVAPLSFALDGDAVAGLTVTVTTGAGCSWSATSNRPWLTVTGGASGIGAGTVVFAVAQNTGGRRDGELTIAGVKVKVRQDRD